MNYLNDLKTRVFGMFDDLVNETAGIEVNHRAEIRASSLPICWRDVAFTEWSKMAGRCPTKKWHLGSELYTSIGTSIHSSVQTFMGMESSLWGSWECHKCGKIYSNQLFPGICCGSAPEYLEYSLVHPDPDIGEFGHCDGILVLPMGLGYIVVEIKTTGESLASSRKMKGPTEEHHMQGSVYYDMFKKGYARVRKRSAPEPGHPRGKVVYDEPAVMPKGKLRRAILFIYIRRDRPRPKFWIPVIVRPLRGLTEEIEKNAPITRAAIREGNVSLPPLCQKFDDAKNKYNWKEICPWAKQICFSKNPEAEAKHLFLLSQKGPTLTTNKKVAPSGSYIKRKNRKR